MAIEGLNTTVSRDHILPTSHISSALLFYMLIIIVMVVLIIFLIKKLKYNFKQILKSIGISLLITILIGIVLLILSFFGPQPLCEIGGHCPSSAEELLVDIFPIFIPILFLIVLIIYLVVKVIKRKKGN